MLRTFLATSSLLLLLASLPCRAVTVTFDDIEHGIPSPDTSYTENGITITSGGGDLGHSETPGAVHLDDFGTSFTASIVVTAERRFTPKKVDLLINEGGPMLSYELLDPDNPENVIGGSYPPNNVLLRGFRNDVLIAETRVSTHELSTFYFDNDFRNLDSLEIAADVDFASAEADLQAAYPGYVLVRLDCGENAPCAHFDVDNLVLSLKRKVCIRPWWWHTPICWWR